MKSTLAEKFVITTLDQLRAISDPLRLRIMELLAQRELTVSGLAQATGAAAGKLYHHVDILLATGLIRVVRREQKRGTEERTLRAVAKEFSVDDKIFLFGADAEVGRAALVEAASVMLGGVAGEFAGAAERGAIDPREAGRRAFLEQQELELTAAQFDELCTRLDAWIADAVTRTTARRATAATARYRFITAFFPLTVPQPTRPPRKR